MTTVEDPGRRDYVDWTSADFERTEDGYQLTAHLAVELSERQERVAVGCIQGALSWINGVEIWLGSRSITVEAPGERLFVVEPAGVRASIEDGLYNALRLVDKEVREVDEAIGEPWLDKLREGPTRR